MGQSWEVTGPDARDIGSATDPIRSVSITVVGGAVDVVAHPSPDVVRYEVGEVDGPPLHVSTERGTVTLSQLKEPGTGLMDALKGLMTAQRRRVRLSVSVPAGVKVTVNAVGADVFVGGSTGTVGVNTVSGAVRLSHLSGRIDVKTANGAIDGSSLSGELVTKTVSGPTTVEASPLRSARLGTVDGAILLDLTAPSCLVTANTVSSDVTVRIPAGAGYDVSATSTSGHVVVDGTTLSGGAEREKGGHRSDGDRAVAAKIRSVSGNVVVLRDGRDGSVAAVSDGETRHVQDDVRGRERSDLPAADSPAPGAAHDPDGVRGVRSVEDLEGADGRGRGGDAREGF